MRNVVIIAMLIISFLNADNTNKLGMYEAIGTQAPLDLHFTDEDGKDVTLRQLADGRPLLLTLNYYVCSGICSPQLNELALTLEQMKLKEGLDYKVITVSINDAEGPAIATQKKKNHLDSINREFDRSAWSFLVGDAENIETLAKAVGFYYEKTVSDSGVVDFIHPSALISISPTGKICRYLNGIKQNPFDVKLAVYEAAQEKTGPSIAKIVNYCFSFDPASKKYVVDFERIIGIVMSLMLFGFLAYLIITGRKNSNYKKGEENE